METVADTNQYTDFTTTNPDYKGGITHSSTNNEFKMQVNGSTTPSLTLNSTTLTTNNITRTGGTFNTLSITRTSGNPTVPTSKGVYIGLDYIASMGLEIVADTNQYIDFTTN